MSQIDKKLKSLERCQSLEEIQRLYESGDYPAVVRLLQPTLSCGPGAGRVRPLELISSAPERPTQLLLLQVGQRESTRRRSPWRTEGLAVQRGHLQGVIYIQHRLKLNPV